MKEKLAAVHTRKKFKQFSAFGSEITWELRERKGEQMWVSNNGFIYSISGLVQLHKNLGKIIKYLKARGIIK